MFTNLASALFLTEQESEDYLDPAQAPKVKGRIITTLEKAKEVRPLVERCITLARRSNEQRRAAEQFGTRAARNSEEWKAWRKSDRYKEWVKGVAPSVVLRRRLNVMLGDKKAVAVLIDSVASRFAKPRLGDAGTRAVLEFVGVRDRMEKAAAAPSFEGGDDAAKK